MRCIESLGRGQGLVPEEGAHRREIHPVLDGPGGDGVTQLARAERLLEPGGEAGGPDRLHVPADRQPAALAQTPRDFQGVRVHARAVIVAALVLDDQHGGDALGAL